MAPFPLARSARLLAALLLAGLLPLTGCGESADVAAARVAFDRYQDCLFDRDVTGLRAVLSRESLQVIPHLPLDRLAGKQRLRVVGARARRPQVLLAVEDPNEDRRTTIVMVREDGKLVVDLVATTAYNVVERPDPSGGFQLLPRDLKPADHARIQAVEAAARR